MNMMNKEPERHEIEALLPWHAAGTLSRRDADRVEQALAGDRELKRRFDIVREELSETIHLNETLGAPSARAMEKLFAAIDAEGVRAPSRRASFDFAGRISDFLVGLRPSHARLVGGCCCAGDCSSSRCNHCRGREGAWRTGELRNRVSPASDRRRIRGGPFCAAGKFGRHHQFPRRPHGDAGRRAEGGRPLPHQVCRRRPAARMRSVRLSSGCRSRPKS